MPSPPNSACCFPGPKYAAPTRARGCAQGSKGTDATLGPGGGLRHALQGPLPEAKGHPLRAPTGAQRQELPAHTCATPRPEAAADEQRETGTWPLRTGGPTRVPEGRPILFRTEQGGTLGLGTDWP